MIKTNPIDLKSYRKRWFDDMIRFQCDHHVGKSRWCHKPATKVIEWPHPDDHGDHDRRRLCDKHAAEEQKYWSARGETGFEISDIELWKIVVCDGGRTVIRIGSKYRKRNPPPDYRSVKRKGRSDSVQFGLR